MLLAGSALCLTADTLPPRNTDASSKETARFHAELWSQLEALGKAETPEEYDALETRLNEMASHPLPTVPGEGTIHQITEHTVRDTARVLAELRQGETDTLYMPLHRVNAQVAVFFLEEGVLRYDMKTVDAGETWPGPWWFLPANETEWKSLKIANAMSHLQNVSISPNRKYLALVTRGEGHPILKVFTLEDLLAGEVIEMAVIDPYPGDLTIAGWQNHKLHLRSIMALDDLNEDGRVREPGTMLDEPVSFFLNPETVEVSRISLILDVDHENMILFEEERHDLRDEAAIKRMVAKIQDLAVPNNEANLLNIGVRIQPQTTHGQLIEFMNAIRSAGLSQITFITTSE